MILGLLMQLSVVLGAYTDCYANLFNIEPTWSLKIQYEPLPNSWLATTAAEPSYYLAIITYDTLTINELIEGMSPVSTSASLRRIVVHELWHVMLWEIGEMAEAAHEGYALRIEEQAITRIERMILWQAFCRVP